MQDRLEPLLDHDEGTKEQSSKMSVSSKILYGLAAVFAITLVGFAVTLGTGSSKTSNIAKANAVGELDNCQIHESVGCTHNEADMNSKFQDHLWNTPHRNTKNWQSGFQDMGTLVGYARQKYSSHFTKCSVTIVTKTRVDLKLTYYFDNEPQSSPTKEFDSDYKGILKVVVVGNDGQYKLELDDIDFMWNLQTLKERSGDYRKGQKGAIVELFGWPDEDVALECKHIAEAGYLGVKLFPHQEQIMAWEPTQQEINPWYYMYQPVSYRLEGRSGSRNQLRETIKKCRSYGLRVYADAVVNHMAAGGNDKSFHRNPGAGCARWGPKNSSASNESPFYSPQWTYQFHESTGKSNNVLEYPSVPYGPMDFHCEKACNIWTDGYNMNTGWLVGLTDLDTSKDYVRQRIADFFIDMMSIGFSGFRIDAAKHMHPYDLAVIFKKFKDGLGGEYPEDFFTWLEVLLGGEAYMLIRDQGEYSYATYLENKLKEMGLTNDEILKIKIWWAAYPADTNTDWGFLNNKRKVIQVDDHDMQNEGSSSRWVGDRGCVLVKGCNHDTHKFFNRKLFEDPYDVKDNDNEYPIRMVLSSYYFKWVDGKEVRSIPDGLSDCSKCKTNCNGCKSREFVKAYDQNAQAYSGSAWTRVHRDEGIQNAMRKWMHIN